MPTWEYATLEVWNQFEVESSTGPSVVWKDPVPHQRIVGPDGVATEWEKYTESITLLLSDLGTRGWELISRDVMKKLAGYDVYLHAYYSAEVHIRYLLKRQKVD